MRNSLNYKLPILIFWKQINSKISPFKAIKDKSDIGINNVIQVLSDIGINNVLHRDNYNMNTKQIGNTVDEIEMSDII